MTLSLLAVGFYPFMGGPGKEGKRKMEEKSPPAGPVCQLPEISPDEVHKNILRCYRLGNRICLRMVQWILVLIERDFAPALGFPRAVYYVRENLQYEKSEAYEVVRVAKSL